MFPLAMLVVSVAAAMEAKDGRMYKTVGFQTVGKTVVIGGKTVALKSNSPVRYRNLFNHAPIDPTQPDAPRRPGDPLYDTITAGDYVEAEEFTVETEPYTIEGFGGVSREVSSYSGIKFPHETIASILKRNGLEPVGGFPTAGASQPATVPAASRRQEFEGEEETAQQQEPAHIQS